jgi:hypothetical protein
MVMAISRPRSPWHHRHRPNRIPPVCWLYHQCYPPWSWVHWGRIIQREWRWRCPAASDRSPWPANGHSVPGASSSHCASSRSRTWYGPTAGPAFKVSFVFPHIPFRYPRNNGSDKRSGVSSVEYSELCTFTNIYEQNTASRCPSQRAPLH